MVMDEKISFSKSVVEDAWKRAEGHCENCGKQLTKNNRGRNAAGIRGRWEAHHVNRSKGGCLSNCQILCVSCHEMAKTFGKKRNK